MQRPVQGLRVQNSIHTRVGGAAPQLHWAPTAHEGALKVRRPGNVPHSSIGHGLVQERHNKGAVGRESARSDVRGHGLKGKRQRAWWGRLDIVGIAGGLGGGTGSWRRHRRRLGWRHGSLRRLQGGDSMALHVTRSQPVLLLGNVVKHGLWNGARLVVSRATPGSMHVGLWPHGRLVMSDHCVMLRVLLLGMGNGLGVGHVRLILHPSLLVGEGMLLVLLCIGRLAMRVQMHVVLCWHSRRVHPMHACAVVLVHVVVRLRWLVGVVCGNRPSMPSVWLRARVHHGGAWVMVGHLHHIVLRIHSMVVGRRRRSVAPRPDHAVCVFCTLPSVHGSALSAETRASPRRKEGKATHTRPHAAGMFSLNNTRLGFLGSLGSAG